MEKDRRTKEVSMFYNDNLIYLTNHNPTNYNIIYF